MAGIKKKVVNWTYNGNEITDISQTPDKSISFIYKILLEDGTDRYYIGRKTMRKPNYTSGKLKGQSKGEYPWKSYCGSSKELLEILKDPSIKYKKEILYFCYSKAETTYKETKEILCSGALTDPLAFNFWIKSLVYSKHLEPNS
jgi:hypothetical protein